MSTCLLVILRNITTSSLDRNINDNKLKTLCQFWVHNKSTDAIIIYQVMLNNYISQVK